MIQSVNSENADAAPAQITIHAVHIITKWKISQKARKCQSKPSFSWLFNNLVSAPIEAKIVSVLVLQRNRDHGVWKLQKKSYFILQVNRYVYWKPKVCGETVVPDMSVLIGQKLVENAKIQMPHFE